MSLIWNLQPTNCSVNDPYRLVIYYDKNTIDEVRRDYISIPFRENSVRRNSKTFNADAVYLTSAIKLSYGITVPISKTEIKILKLQKGVNIDNLSQNLDNINPNNIMPDNYTPVQNWYVCLKDKNDSLKTYINDTYAKYAKNKKPEQELNEVTKDTIQYYNGAIVCLKDGNNPG